MKKEKRTLLSWWVSICLAIHLVFPGIIQAQVTEEIIHSTWINNESEVTTEAPITGVPGNPLEKPQDERQYYMQVADNVVGYLKDSINEQNTGIQDWYALTIARAGEETPDSYEETIKDYLSSCQTEEQLDKNLYGVSGYSRLIMALYANGYDVTDVSGYNLIERVGRYDKLENKYPTILAYLLIALDTGRFKETDTQVYTRQELIKILMDKQQDDGSYGYGGDVDTTAMIVQALAPYYEEDEAVKNTIDEALEWLSSVQQPNGGYISWGSDNGCGLAQVICALISVGRDPLTEPDFIKSEGSTLSHLMTFYDEATGGFKAGGKVDHDFLTPQAAYALVAYKRFLESKTSLYDMTDVFINKTIDTRDTVVVEQGSKIELGSDKDQLKLSIHNDITDAVLELGSRQDSLPSIEIIGEGYKVKFNKGTAVTSSDISSIELPALEDSPNIEELEGALGQEIEKVESALSIGDKQQPVLFNKKVRITFENLAGAQMAYKDHKGQIVPIRKVKENEEKQEYNEVCYDQDKDLILETNHFTQFLVYKLDSTSSSQEREKVRLIVSADQIDKGILYNQEMVLEEGDSVLDVLKRTGLKLVEKAGYVSAIEDIKEFDYGPQSGWMYSINGAFPKVGASQYKVLDGHEIKWQYTKDGGEDLGDHYIKDSKEQSDGSGTVSADVLGVQEALQKKWLDAEKLSPWQIFSLGRLGLKVKPELIDSLINEVSNNQGAYRKPTDLERTILVLGSMKIDCQEVAGINLIEKLYNHSNLKMQGSNGLIFALLALDSRGYKVPEDAKWTREELIKELLDYQKEDGGFGLSQSSKSEVDLTAMAIQALAPYQNETEVKKTLDKAVYYLSKAQREDGQFESNGVANSESLAQVIIALSTLKIDVQKDSRFIKEGYSLIDLLLEYRVGEEGFSHLKDGGQDVMATEQGMMALVSYHCFLEKTTSLYYLGNAPAPTKLEKEENKGEDKEVEVLEQYKDKEQISNWARQELSQAVAKGIIKGYGDELKPQQQVTRAEFITMLIRTIKIEPVKGPNIFKDITKEDWYYEEVMSGYHKGYIKGMNSSQFKPNEKINREQLATIIERAFDLGEQKDAKLPFYDEKEISQWAVKAVSSSYKAGVINGYEDHTFRPKQILTREMAAIILARLQEEPNQLNN